MNPPASRERSRLHPNDFNQVAYLGTDSAGKQAIFSTNLGTTRKVVAVGDFLVEKEPETEVTSLALYNGLMNSGQLVYRATIVGGTEYAGGQYVVRTNRAYMQARVVGCVESPVTVPWQDTKYLLRSVAGSGFEPTKSIGSDGCNMVSTVNLLGFYNNDVTPSEFQDWLLFKYNQASQIGTNPDRYIVQYIESGKRRGNDFRDPILTELTSQRVAEGLTDTVVEFLGVYNPDIGGNTNFKELVSDLRAGRAVKLRVPSGGNLPPPPPDPSYSKWSPYGHFVLAYGLKDPTKPEPITIDDVLIHDPYRDVINTLRDYDSLLQTNFPGDRTDNRYDPNWFEQNVFQRLYRYTATGTVGFRDLNGGMFSPAVFVITDPLGRRLGFDPGVGLLHEIPGRTYWEEESYDSVDTGEPVWEGQASVKQFFIEDVMLGHYSLEIIGTGNGAYKFLLDPLGLLDSDIHSLSGEITAGERLSFDVNVTVIPEPVPGDANRDGKVDDLDAAILAAHWQQLSGAAWTDGDFNGDGNVNDLDASILAANWQAGGGSAVPEPAGWALLVGLAVVLLARRVRRERLNDD